MNDDLKEKIDRITTIAGCLSAVTEEHPNDVEFTIRYILPRLINHKPVSVIAECEGMSCGAETVEDAVDGLHRNMRHVIHQAHQRAFEP